MDDIGDAVFKIALATICPVNGLHPSIFEDVPVIGKHVQPHVFVVRLLLAGLLLGGLVVIVATAVGGSLPLLFFLPG